MLKPFAALLVCLLPACYPDRPADTIQRSKITAAPVRQSAYPTLIEARKQAVAADELATRAHDRVVATKEGLSDAQVELHALVVEADRLRNQKQADAGELLAMYNRLVAQEKQAAVLVRSVSEAEVALASERFLRTAISEELSKAEQLTITKDAEGEQLRNQLTLSEASADAMQNAAQHNAKLANASADRAAASEGRSSTLTRALITAIIFGVVSFALNIIQLKRI